METPTPTAILVRRPRTPSRPRSRSTIARLTHQTREFLNQALREGEPYEFIAARLNVLLLPHEPRPTPNMLSRWYRTGYRDWLAQQTLLESAVAQSTAAVTELARLRHETGDTLSDLTETLLAHILQKALQDFDPAAINTLLAEKPAEFFRLISCANAHLTARSHAKTTEVAAARCQVDIATKAQAARQPLESSTLNWERQMVDKTFGGPYTKLKRLLESENEDKPSAAAPPTRHRRKTRRHKKPAPHNPPATSEPPDSPAPDLSPLGPSNPTPSHQTPT
jgi:hypothetical protein